MLYIKTRDVNQVSFQGRDLLKLLPRSRPVPIREKLPLMKRRPLNPLREVATVQKTRPEFEYRPAQGRRHTLHESAGGCDRRRTS
jgi:hypothetical protein